MMTSPWFAAPWLRLTRDFGQAAQAAAAAAAANSSGTPTLRAICVSFAISRTPPARQASRCQPGRHLVCFGPDRLGPVPSPGRQQPPAPARPSQLIDRGRRRAPP